MSVAGQGFKTTTVTETPEQQTWIPLITPSVDGALSIFAHAQQASINALAELQKPGGLYERRANLVKKQRELELNIELIAAKWLIEYDFEKAHGKTNEKQRDAIMLLALAEQEDYAAVRDELDEVKHENTQVFFAIDSAEYDLSICRRQMDMATELLHAMAR